MASFTRSTVLTRLFTLLIGTILCTGSVWAVPMTNDPRGFHDIAWGASLTLREDLELSRGGSSVREYQRRGKPPSFGGVEITSIRYLSVDDQFARVTIRYQGEQVHEQVLKFLESQFGPLERIPGQMARGLTQQYNWRGSDTEINLTYQASTERGYIFIDSRTLAPRFNDNLTDSAE